jgi:hypothetical protein
MAAILSCRAILNHRSRRRGCLIEFLYPTGRGLADYRPINDDFPGVLEEWRGREAPGSRTSRNLLVSARLISLSEHEGC